ncbi:MAG: V-type ATP synthase subunit I [Candidatus Bathyarchaeota archaeon]|nr:V-type ATP synthase subunit I [Candidatus Bathyarchaeota archaeon]
MIRSERVAATSIICVKEDVEQLLEALSGFGEFHIEQTGETSVQYKQNIQQAEQSLATVEEITKHVETEKPRLLDTFKTIEPQATQITAENWQSLLVSTSQEVQKLKNQFDEHTTALTNLEQENSERTQVKGRLTIMKNMGADLEAIENLKLIHIEIAKVPIRNVDKLETALSSLPAYFNRCSLNKEADYACIAMPSKFRAEVEKILKMHHAESIQIPQDLPSNVDEALKQVNQQLDENAKKEKTFKAEIKKLGKENRANITVWRETIQNILELLKAEEKFLQSERLATVNGYVPEKKFEALGEKVKDTLGEKALVLENTNAKFEDHPTKFNHNRFVRPFEEITKLYGVPTYSEFDPTPILAITFPLIFGLMFGDIGHGLVLLVGGAAVGFLMKNNQSIRNVGWILAACGIGAIVAGALFDEFFGIAIHPLWMSPFHDVLTFLIFSMIVGVIQIESGFVLEMANYLFKHKIVDALLDSVPKIAFYIGSVYLIATCQLDFGKWFQGPVLAVIIPFIILVIGKPIVAKVHKPKITQEHDGEEEHNSLGERLFEGGDLVTRLLSNTISYSRILALLMAHWALLLVVYSISGLVGTANPLTLILSGVIVVFGNIFVLALEGLIVFIHTMRLHFYEWFSKFYQGTGTPFQPFKQNFTYTTVTFKKKAENTPSNAKTV